MSPCLCPRIAYGTTVTIERLSKVDRGEEILRELGIQRVPGAPSISSFDSDSAQSEMDRVLRKEGLVESLRPAFANLVLSMSLSISFRYLTGEAGLSWAEAPGSE